MVTKQIIYSKHMVILQSLCNSACIDVVVIAEHDVQLLQVAQHGDQQTCFLVHWLSDIEMRLGELLSDWTFLYFSSDVAL